MCEFGFWLWASGRRLCSPRGFELNYLPSDPRSANATRYLRRDEGANARGQMLSSRFGSGDASQAYQWLVSEYDASTGWLLSRCSGLTVCSGVAQSGTAAGYSIDTNATMKLGYEYDYFGNVSKSVNIGKRPGGITGDVQQETFGYDPLHRMTSASRAGPGVNAPQVTYTYSPVGNLWAKSDFGTDYLYNDPAHKHAVKQVTLAGGVGTMHYNYDANGNVITRTRKSNIESFGYDIDNRPQWTNTITHTGSTARIDFYLSATGAKALQVAGGAQPRVVIYAGAYEAEYTGAQLTASRTYLAEGVLHNGAGTPVEQGGQMGLSFMHQDRLGSALVISDKGGGILGSDNGHAEFRTFDAFGKARDNQGLDNLGGRLFANNPNGKRNRKGFTGHEHLDEAGLIHMNGRTYDYNLGRFYGVDPVIQFPTNSQSLNGYSYLMNNPLSGTDPTGYKTCDVSQATSCLEEGANQIMDGDKDLGVINLTDSGKDTYSAGVNLTAAGHEYVAARTLANGGSNLQSAAGGQGQKPGADKVGESTKRPNSTVGDEVYQNRGIQLVGMDSTGRNLGNEVGVALATAIPCTLSGPGMLACMAGGSVLLEDGPNSPGFEVGVNLMAPSAGAVLERAVVALVGKAASALGRAAVEAAERIKVPTAPVPEAMQAPVSMQQLKYHYTTSPDSAFADGFRAHSSVTDRANLLPYEAHQTLGIPIPTRVIPIIDRGTFGPKSDVLDTDTYFGGGTQYFNSNRIPPGDILPGFDLPK